MALFTKDNAREMSAKGNQVRWAEPREPEPTQKPADSQPRFAGTLPANDGFSRTSLLRVRKQLDLVNDSLLAQLSKSTIDPQAIDRLSNAQMRLSEQERILAGRPLPGSHRPRPERADRRQAAPEPEPEPETPQPVVACVPAKPPIAPDGTPPVQAS